MSAFLLALAILLPPQADDTERMAARELQHWVKEISGEEWPLAEAGSGVRLGRAFAEGKFDDDLKALEGTDGFAVRRRGDDVYVFGAMPRGTLFGVYALLEENSDLIWARPQFTVFTKTKAFELKNTNFLCRPKSTLRQIGFTVTGPTTANFEWFIRNRGNSVRGNGGKRNGKLIADARLIREGGGHCFCDVVPPKRYFKEHPEYYAEVNGVRREKANALCFSAKGLGETFFRELCKYIDASQPIDDFILGMEDSNDTCTCAECRKPIKAADGSWVKPGDRDFKSTQWFRFVNPIADAVKAKYGFPLPVYAYFYLTIPPRIRVSDAIVPLFHPVPRNQFRDDYTKPILNTNGDSWEKRMDGYRRMCTGTIRLREYYGCGGIYPKALEGTIRDDSLFVLKKGITELSTEFPTDKDAPEFKVMPSKVWDSRGIGAWVMMRLWWDPTADVEALRTRYLERTYHGAAPAMRRYLDRADELWRTVGPDVSAAGLADTIGRKCFVTTGAEKEMRGYLEEAAKKVDHPVSAELVRRARAIFEELCGTAKRLSAAKVAARPAETDWTKAQPIDAFEVFGFKDAPVPVKTSVSLLHDGTTLYLRAVASDAVPGDRLVFHFATAANGDGKVVTLPPAVCDKAGQFVYETSVPLKDLGCTPGAGNVDRVYAVFYRYAKRDKAHLTLRGQTPANARYYVDIILER